VCVCAGMCVCWFLCVFMLQVEKGKLVAK
jgi:hypothetical protein